MQDQRDDGRAHPIKDRRHRLQVTEINVEGTQGGDDHEIREDEGPSARPCSPETASQIRDVDAHLDGERPRQRLTDGDGLSHLLLGQPTPLSDQFPFHLTNERDRPPKAKKAEPQTIELNRHDTRRRLCVAYSISCEWRVRRTRRESARWRAFPLR